MFLGMSTIVFLILWTFYASDSAEQHKFISKSEKSYIMFSLKGIISNHGKEKVIKS